MRPPASLLNSLVIGRRTGHGNRNSSDKCLVVAHRETNVRGKIKQRPSTCLYYFLCNGPWLELSCKAGRSAKRGPLLSA